MGGLPNEFSSEDENFDSNKFWYENLSRGKLNFKIKEILQNLGIDRKEINKMLSNTKRAKSAFSSSVHSSIESAIRCKCLFSLGNPGLVSTTSLGHQSIHTPGLMSFIIMEIYRFGAMLTKMIISNKPPILFAKAGTANSSASLLVSIFTLQELTEKYDTLLFDQANNYREQHKQ